VISNTPTTRRCGTAGLPDTDAVLYRLAGLFNASGFGVREESFHALEMLGAG